MADSREENVAAPAARWCRWHWSTWLTVCIVAAALVLANVPGDASPQWESHWPHYSGIQPIGFRGVGQSDARIHGWPLTYLRRESLTGEADSWSLTRDVDAFDPLSLALDVGLALVICCAAVVVCERRRRTARTRRFQLSLRGALLLLVVFCGLLAWWAREARWELSGYGDLKSTEHLIISLSEPRFPDWIRELVGDSILRKARLNRPIFVQARLPGANLEHLRYTLACHPSQVQVELGKSHGESALAQLRSLPDLQLLYVEDVDDHTLASIGELTNLRDLVLEHQSGSKRQTSRAGWEHLGRLTRLRSLHLELSASRSAAGDLSWLRGLTQLEAFTVAHHNVTGGLGVAGMRNLANLKRLRTIDLPHAGITNDELAHLSRLTRLTSLYLPGNQIDSGGLAHLADLRKLRYLNLDKNKIRDSDLASLACMKQLEILSLNYTNVGDRGLAHLNHLDTLSHLCLDGTRVKTMRGLDRRLVENLLSLDVMGTRATKAAIDRLAGLNPQLSITYMPW